MEKLITLILIIAAFSLNAATIHIDPTAQAGGDGSLLKPYNTWSQAQATFADGNTYLFRAGTTIAAVSFSTQKALSNVTFDRYGSGAKPILLCTSTNSKTKALDFNGRLNNVTIRNLVITSTTGLITTLIYVCHFSVGVNIINCDLHDAQWGIRIRSLDAAPYNRVHNLRIEGCRVWNIKDDGLYLYMPIKYEITNTKVWQVNQNWYPGASQTIASGDGAQIIGGNQGKITGCEFNRSDTGNKFCLIIAGTTSTPGNYLIIENNIFTSPMTTGQGGAAVYIGTGVDHSIDFNFNCIAGDRSRTVSGLTGIWYQASSGTLSTTGNDISGCSWGIQQITPRTTVCTSIDNYFYNNSANYSPTILSQ